MWTPDLDIMLEQHTLRFKHSIAPFMHDNAELPLRVKYEHTFNVLDVACEIVRNEPAQKLGKEPARAIVLAALYHDIARFEQFTTYRTFHDKLSFNHGAHGVRLIKRHKLVQDESLLVQRMTLAAVGLHNRYRLPPRLDPILEGVVHAVRDADKVDIFRVMATHLNAKEPSQEVVLSVKNEPDRWSEGIVRSVLQKKVPSYSDLRYFNDFRLLLFSWLYDLHYASAKNRLIQSGHVEKVLEGLPQALSNIKDTLLQHLQDMEEGIKHVRT